MDERTAPYQQVRERLADELEATAYSYDLTLEQAQGFAFALRMLAARSVRQVPEASP